MPSKGGPLFAGDGVPDFDGLVESSGRDCLAIRSICDRADDVRMPTERSQLLGACHVPASHMAIGMAVHKNLMNPRTNVRLHEFWQLHFFINDRFEEKLANFAPGSQPAATVAQLEANPAAPTI